MQITFTFEKPTTHATRWQEDDEESPVVGTLYIKQWALEDLGLPEVAKLNGKHKVMIDLSAVAAKGAKPKPKAKGGKAKGKK